MTVPTPFVRPKTITQTRLQQMLSDYLGMSVRINDLFALCIIWKHFCRVSEWKCGVPAAIESNTIYIYTILVEHQQRVRTDRIHSSYSVDINPLIIHKRFSQELKVYVGTSSEWCFRLFAHRSVCIVCESLSVSVCVSLSLSLSVWFCAQSTAYLCQRNRNVYMYYMLLYVSASAQFVQHKYVSISDTLPRFERIFCCSHALAAVSEWLRANATEGERSRKGGNGGNIVSARCSLALVRRKMRAWLCVLCVIFWRGWAMIVRRRSREINLVRLLWRDMMSLSYSTFVGVRNARTPATSHTHTNTLPRCVGVCVCVCAGRFICLEAHTFWTHDDDDDDDEGDDVFVPPGWMTTNDTRESAKGAMGSFRPAA